jgi:phosphate:Na+ symporter
MNFHDILSLAAGLSLFLYGMQRSEKALKLLAGSRMRVIVDRVTSNRVMALLVGLLVTMGTQSSSATTVMLVGFATAGLLSLEHSMGAILGTAVGTTLTVQLFAWNVTRVAPLLIAVGFLLALVRGSERRRTVGKLVFAFGLLFFGMQMMSTAASGLRQSSLFEILLRTIDSPWALMIAGALFTSIIQSSAATVALVIGLVQSGGGMEGSVVSLAQAVPLVLGSNVGTCATALIAATGASTEGKQVAWAHLMYKSIAVLAGMPLIPVLTLFAEWSAPGNPAAQVANAHTLFNVSAAILFLPLTGVLAAVTRRLVKARSPVEDGLVVRFVDREFPELPYLSLAQASKEVVRMSGIVTGMVETAWKALKERNPEILQTVRSEDDRVDFLQERITPYLARLAETEMTAEESSRQIALLAVASELELIGDIVSKDLLKSVEQFLARDQRFSDAGQKELDSYYSRVRVQLYTAVDAFSSGDAARAASVIAAKQTLDQLHAELRISHFDRVRHGSHESLETTTVHLDILEDLRRVGSHAARLCGVSIPQMPATTLHP